MPAWTIFQNPITIHSDSLLWLLAPLCVAVAVVYKAIRVHDIRRFHWEVLVLLGYMLVGLVVLGGGLWLLQEYWP